MKNFYEKVSNLPINKTHFLLTGLDKSICGEKWIISDKQVVFGTIEQQFDETLLESIYQAKKPRVIETKNGKIYFEKLGTTKKMIICGGGHVGAAVIAIGKMIEFEISVIEDRPTFAEYAKQAGADHVVCDEFSHALKEMNIDTDTFVLIVTRGHRHDAVCLREILGKPYGYLGMIGSKARVIKMKQQLIEEGYRKEELESMHSPIGLSIDAKTPQEIAVSIMAEIIQVKNKSGKGTGFEKEVSDYLFKKKEEIEPVVLATIVERKGSAPRDVGTKMIIKRDGKTLGTIGGGCVEADICTRARHILSNMDKKMQIVTSDLTGRDAEEDGMVCGGIVTITMELIDLSLDYDTLHE